MFNFFKKKKRQITLVNGTLTIVLVNGTQLTITNSNKEQYDYVSNPIYDDSSIIEYYYDILALQKEDKRKIAEIKKEQGETNTITEVIAKKEKQKKVEQKKEVVVKAEVAQAHKILSTYPILVNNGDFEENNGVLYMKTSKGSTIPISVPKLLVDKFVELMQKINKDDAEALDEYCALKNFWMWTSLNPSAPSRESMFRYLKNNHLRINKYGFFFAYRKVESVRDDKYSRKEVSELSEYISNIHTKIKGWKKNPANFDIFQDIDTKEFFYSGEKTSSEVAKKTKHEHFLLQGNLKQLYLDLQKEEIPTTKVQHYTDQYTHKMDIIIGREVSLRPEECDWNVSNECSRGLHISGSEDYGCGDTSIIVMVNPAKVVACPYQDGHKMRVCAYMPIAVVNSSTERGKILDSLDTLEIGTEYYENCTKELAELVKNNTPEELVQHKYINELSKEAVKLISKEADNIRKTISQRVIKG